jgi:hypothetical protein
MSKGSSLHITLVLFGLSPGGGFFLPIDFDIRHPASYLHFESSSDQLAVYISVTMRPSQILRSGGDGEVGKYGK